MNLAHGESWEIAASHAISNLVKKVLDENDSGRAPTHRRGTFSLHYTPTNFNEKVIAIPLSTSNGVLPDQSTYMIENDGQRYTYRDTIIRC